MREGAGRMIGGTIGATALGWLAHGLVHQWQIANGGRARGSRRRRRKSRGLFHVGARDGKRPKAKGGQGALWTGMAALLLRRSSLFHDLRRTLIVGALLGAATWAGGLLGLIDTEDSERSRGRRTAGTGRSLVGQVVYGIVGVLPLYLSSRFEAAKRAGANMLHSPKVN